MRVAPRQTEIDQLRATIVVEQHIARGQIAVHDVVRVQMREPSEHVSAKSQNACNLLELGVSLFVLQQSHQVAVLNSNRLSKRMHPPACLVVREYQQWK